MSEKVLLVDDEHDFVETLAERMRSRGMEVSATTSPIDALKKTETENYDAIILDLMMPEMDGLETLRILKEKNPDLQVILLTGQATVEKGVEAMKLGAMDLMEKPADLKALTEKIRKAQARKMIIVEKKTEDRIKTIIGGKGW
ncbi:MAG: two-component system response regulator [Desulfobacteraceae bacterium IS3]|nr:MAG: two-component system response regulator [Desulfobacteraceae bacterium IS3]